ncbi:MULTISPECIES: site-specific integrase [Christiangramia]|jgi:integrase|uniref:Integrase n=2 Tax=Christiangramia TaxID=292691 RepID=A0A1L7I913_9FLAO|nr:MULTISPECIES: site-specific integrase [Christiangramia]APU69724.1 Integrase [Christiangramia flava JLT2011]OSS39243.1 phage integrase family protein [Christiangramia flava JLT2011]HBC03627.1 site-specific integrase [Aequorivita sp.]
MANLKIVLRKNMKKKDGRIPLALRISENYKTNYVWLGHSVFEKDWDNVACKVKKTHPNFKQLNNFLMKRMIEVNDIYFNAEKKITPRQIKQKLKGPDGSKSFFTVATEHIQSKYDTGVFSVAKAQLSILYNIEEFIQLKNSRSKAKIIQEIKQRRLKRVSEARRSKYHWMDGVAYFKKNDNLRFRDIDESFIRKYKTFCSSYLNHKPRTITNQLIFIRTLYNIAIKEGVIAQKYYPFAGEKEKIRISSGNKIGLNVEEIEKIESLELEKYSTIWHTHNIWLFSFYFAGMRISDVIKLKWSDFKDKRLYYVMEKNGKPLSLKIPDKARIIIDYYRPDKKFNNGYLFPFLREVDQTQAEQIYTRTKSTTKLLNKYLKRIAKLCGIDKTLSNHIARHSFGNIAGDRIHPLMLQKLYRHSDLKTTLNYQANFIHRDADEALDSVINF